MLGALAQKLAPTAQVVSVYDKTRSIYNYYLVPRGVHLRMAEPPPGRPAFGEALEAMLPSLPRASLWVGSGPRARGRLAVKRYGGGASLGAALAALLDRYEP